MSDLQLWELIAQFEKERDATGQLSVAALVFLVNDVTMFLQDLFHHTERIRLLCIDRNSSDGTGEKGLDLLAISIDGSLCIRPTSRLLRDDDRVVPSGL